MPTNSLKNWLSSVAGDRKTELVTILILASLQGFLWTMMIPVVPLLARDNGATELQLGVITAIPALTTILSCIPGNSLGMRFGKRALFIWSQCAGLLCGLLFFLTSGLWFMAIPQVIFGISNSLFWPTQTAYITEVLIPAKRASAIGCVMATSALTSILSPSIAGYIIDRAGYKPVFILYMAIAAAGLATARTLPRIATGLRGSVAATILTGYGSVGSLLKQPMLQITTMSSFLQFTTLATMESFVSAYLRQANYSATFIGTTVALRTATTTAMRLFMGPMVARLGAAPLLFGGVLTCAAAGGLVPVFPYPAYICAANVLIGAGFGAVPVMISTLIAENTSPHERGIAMALDTTSGSSGRSATGFGFGGIAQMVGYGRAIVIANCFVIAGMLLTVQRYRRKSGIAAPASARIVRMEGE